MFQLHFKTAYRESGTQDPGLVIRDPGPSSWDPSPETQNPGPIGAILYPGPKTFHLGSFTWDLGLYM